MRNLFILLLPAWLAAAAFCAEPSQEVNVLVDPRIELYSAVLYLSDFRGLPHAPVLTSFDSPYFEDVKEYFAPFKEHQAVRLYNEMSKTGFWLGHPPAVLVNLSWPPELEEKYPVDPFRVQMAGGKEKLDLFLESLRSFARDTGFMDFYQAHGEYFRESAENYREGLDSTLVDDLERYFGCRQNSYNVVLAPLFLPGGFGLRVKVAEGLYDAYYVGGPLGLEQGRPHFENDIRVFWHEFSHSFVNHLTEANLDGLMAPCTVLFADQKEEVEKYGIDWSVQVADQVSEHVVRGITTRLSLHKEGRETAEAFLKKEIRQGFPYVPEVCASLEQYEKQRDRYPALKDYFPEIVKVFERLASEKQSER